MDKNYSESEIRGMIDKILIVLEKNFKYNYGKKIEYADIVRFIEDLNSLYEIYSPMNAKECGKSIITRYIKLLDLMISIDNNPNDLKVYVKCLENAYKLAGRVSLEHFIIYYEWEEEEKLYETRVEILQPYVYFLNKMCFDRSFEGIIVNLPSGYGKSRLLRLYEAFRLGIESGGTFLSLCSNDDLIKGQSRSVIDIIKNPRYGNVFTELKYNKKDKKFFLKETDGEWKLNTCKLIASYYAKTVNSNIVGFRASLSIDIDDLYSGWEEALDENINRRYYNDFVTVWRKRYVQDKSPQIIIAGTLWSPTDFLSKIIGLWEKEEEFVKHTKFKFTRISKDGKKAIIQVPALDYETGESTCPRLKSTAELLKERASMDNYLWETNFQQRPIPPDGLDFDYENLRTYSEPIANEEDLSYAVIDGTRTSGKDYFAMPIFCKYYQDYALIDSIFTREATSELIDSIVKKVVEHHIVTLVIESNVDGGLKKVIDDALKDSGVYYCEIIEKYNTVKKAIRIELEKGVIKRRIVFPAKHLNGTNTDLGKFMQNLTTYSSILPNRNDDAPDSVGMFTSEVIGERSKPQKAKPIKRLF